MNERIPNDRRRSYQTPPQPPRKRRRYSRRRILLNRILAVLVLLACLSVIVGLVWLLFLRGTTFPGRNPVEPPVSTPEPFDAGRTAVSWEKNENGIYFSSNGSPILEATLKGIDVSKFQGEMDWEKALEAGIDFAIIRCGFGSEWRPEDGDPAKYGQDDDQWRRNADECTRLGIPFGVYLYSYATTVERARLEADHVARLLGLTASPAEGLADYTETPYQLSYPVYYDLEDLKITDLFPEEAAELAAAFFDQLESYGYTGEQGIYASLNWVRGRLQDPGFDKWRNNFWIARFSSSLGYIGPYRMWQSTHTESGEKYGAQSEDIDVDFIMEPLRITGFRDADSPQTPTYTGDTYGDDLWLPGKDAAVTLVTNEPAGGLGGQPLRWYTSDASVATVDENGYVCAQGDGTCTITAIQENGRLSAECTVYVGAVTIPIFATGALHGEIIGETMSLADVAALAATESNHILLDAGGSLQGTTTASLTGGMVMTEAFANLNYHLQAVGGQDLAFGVSRLRSDAASAIGPTLAANLRTPENVAVFHRSKSWSNNRITNGMHYVVERAGHRIGFFALVETGTDFARYAVTNETAPLAADLTMTANEQVAALRGAGAEAIICILPPAVGNENRQALQTTLAGLGVTAVIDGSRTASEGSELALPTLPAATGLDFVARLDLIFNVDGTVSTTVTTISAEELQAARLDTALWTAKRATAYERAATRLAGQIADNAELLEKTLFTLAEPDKTQTVSFGNYVAELYQNTAQKDKGNWDPAGSATLYALAGGVSELEPGEITRAALIGAVPNSERLQLVETTYSAYAQLVNNGTVQTYKDAVDGVNEKTDAQTPICLITDTATLRQMNGGYTVLRDYGDAFWVVRMAINDATGGFANALKLSEAKKK